MQNEPKPLSLGQWRICEDFREAWGRGERAKLGSHLSRCLEPAARADLFWHLLDIEFKIRQDGGEAPSFEDYTEFVPEFRDILCQRFHGGRLGREEPHLAGCADCRAFLMACRTTPVIEKVSNTGFPPQTTLGFPPPFQEKWPATASHQLESNREQGFAYQFGEYQILGRLGTGGMGSVFRARQARLDREVALKRPDPTKQLGYELFKREPRLAASIKSRHVVTIFDCGEVDGQPYLTQELLAGRSLASVLESLGGAPLPTSEVIRISREIAEGLAGIHAQNVVHRDIKPSNIFLEEPGNQVKIIDFGLACNQQAEASLTDGHVVGTPGWMAPEQAHGERATTKVDMYALGLVMRRMLEGHDLETRKEPPVPLRAKPTNEDRPAAQPHLTEDTAALQILIRRLLEEDPWHRPPATLVARLLSAPIEVIPPRSAESLADTELAGGSPALTPALGRWFWPWVLAASCLLLAVAGALAFLISNSMQFPAPENNGQGKRSAFPDVAKKVDRWFRVRLGKEPQLVESEATIADLPPEWFRPMEDKFRDPVGTLVLPPDMADDLDKRRIHTGFQPDEGDSFVFVTNRFVPSASKASFRWDGAKWNIRAVAYLLDDMEGLTRLVGQRAEDRRPRPNLVSLELDLPPGRALRLVLFVFPVDRATCKRLRSERFQHEAE